MTNDKRAIFLDKDGTLIEDVPYNVDPDQMRLTVGVESLRQLHESGYLLIIISNQSGVARGYFPEAALEPVKQRSRELLAQFDIPLTDFYFCPHHPEGMVGKYAIDCHCRKPKPGLLLQAAHDYTIDLSQSWFIGDILNDVEAGRRAGCQTILLDNGNETEWIFSPDRIPHHVATDLSEAVDVIEGGRW
ncbi:HAD family hydrolase [Kovacikia minuta CCNUW1]|uniref:D-glycero-alpha-D-manno-heptose-1,7-bisphosphate 7-phosphatase n=1 Tax=Kovacikia minuta TaxID=2931930 RepID=UPI001CCD42F7|nr:HAD family hydrolase [Kovacikia minuta]UBF26524.1 HAD family hydrolase [Kovacikia minuta CCNUW1]